MSEPADKPRRRRAPSAATIIKAAKAAGAASVTFPDGTVVTMALEPALVISGTTDEWDGARPM